MKLSVLIPMYNAESFIERCLESLMNQNISKEDYEVIVFNDGSNDRSKEIVERFIKTHSNVFLHSHNNEGVISTRNKLITLAKGAYVYFMDADDYVAYNCLGDVLTFATHSKIDILGFNTLVTKEDAIFNLNKTFQEFELPKIVSGDQFLKENINLRIEIWWYLIRKDFLHKHKLAFIDRDYDGDVVFTLRLFLYAQRVAYSPVAIYRYFQSPESTMRSDNIAYKRKIVQYFMALINDLNNLIATLDKFSIRHEKVIANNFKFRRDAFTFFTIIKMIKAEFSIKAIKEKLFELEKIGAYPIKSFIREDYKSFKYKLLAYILNHKTLLFIFVKLHKIYTKIG